MKKIKHAGKTVLALCSALALLAGCGKAASTNTESGSMNTTSSSAGTLTALDSAAVNASSESGTSGTESTASAAGSTGSSKNESPDSSAAPAADPTSAPESPAAPSEDPAGIDFVSTETSLYTYEQMMTDLSEMAAAYPDLLTVRSCGTSLDGREIPEAILGNPESAHHILIQASIHAREYINTLVAMEQIEYFLHHHADGMYADASYDQLLSYICFHILPMSNPDGVSISQFGPDAIENEDLRAGLSDILQNDLNGGRTSGGDSYWTRWKANARGVDLNRNFDAGWDMYEGVPYPSSDHYKGTSPASEPETQAILNAADSCNAMITISYHSMGGVIYWDYGSSGEVYDKDYALMSLVSVMTGYAGSSSVQSSQDAAGCSDYFVLVRGVPSVTIENGYSECPIGIGEYPSIWSANAELLPALAFAYKNG